MASERLDYQDYYGQDRNLRKLGVLQMVYRRFHRGDERHTEDEVLSRVLDEIANELGQGVDVVWGQQEDARCDMEGAWGPGTQDVVEEQAPRRKRP